MSCRAVVQSPRNSSGSAALPASITPEVRLSPRSLASSIPSSATSLASVPDRKVDLDHVFRVLDYAEYGGAPLLGVNGLVMIMHGRSDRRAMANAMRASQQFVIQPFTADGLSLLQSWHHAGIPIIRWKPSRPVVAHNRIRGAIASKLFHLPWKFLDTLLD